MSRSGAMSPDQRTDQICRHTGHMILEAGAGTGKTYSLTKRVIYQLVERKVPLERMLALTFTDFAAAEMRTRIYKAINERLREETNSVHGEDSDKNPTATHLLDTRRRFTKNYISTFHAFCNRILQYFPDELAAIRIADEPDFSEEISAASAASTASAASAASATTTGQTTGKPSTRHIEGSFELLGDHDEVLWMLEWRKSFYRKYRKHSGLQRQLSRLSVADFERFMNLIGKLDDQVLAELAEMAPEGYISMLRKLKDDWEREKKHLESILAAEFEAHPEWFKKPEGRPILFSDMKAFMKKGGGFQVKFFNKEEMDPDQMADINKLGEKLLYYAGELEKAEAYLSRTNLADALHAYPGQEEFDSDHEAYWNMRDLAELAMRWHYLMRFQRFDAGYFNYDDMIWLTHRLFEENPEVVRQMRSRFDQILVDEFQDTDRRQWDIIRKLGFGDAGFGDDRPGMDHDKEILIVGDVKQAIYAFRGGDVAMMQKAHRDLAMQPGSEPGIVPLTYSFRSNPSILGFANSLFRGVFGSASETASYEASHQPLHPPSSAISKNASEAGEVRILRADYKTLEKHKNEWSVRAEALAGHMELLEARRIARFLREIYDGRVEQHKRITGNMRAGKPAVGILYRRRNHMPAMEQALAENGLRYTVAKGSGFYGRREIRDAWLLLSFLLDAHDDVALAGVFRSPMIALSDTALLAIRMVMDESDKNYPNFWSVASDHRRWADDYLTGDDRFMIENGVSLLETLRKQVPVRRVSDLLEYVFFNDGAWFGAYAGDSQVQENLVKLLDVTRKLESTGRGTLFEITRFLSDRIHDEASESEAEHPDPAPIQLMTIHSAKGLQFPMVVIPDMYAGLVEGGVQLQIAASDEESKAWPAMAYKQANKESEESSDDSFLNQVLKTENRKRSLAELKRLFYVAVTRAETHLLLSLSKGKGTGESGTLAELLRPWLAGAADVVIEDLDLEELETLAHVKSDPTADRDDSDEQVREKEGTTPRESLDNPPVLLDRDRMVFQKADKQVSVDVTTASSVEQKELPEDVTDGHSGFTGFSMWQGLDPADAGTLIHRTLEMGLASPETEQAVWSFWQMELLQMGYAKPAEVVRKNQAELLRHCRNALTWVRQCFNEPPNQRFEVAFELRTRDEDRLVTIRGSIDMVLTDQQGHDHIIDFKTGPLETGQEAIGKKNTGQKETGQKETGQWTDADLRDHAKKFGYDRQVDLYRKAYIELTGKDIPGERVWLLFTAPQKPIAVNFPKTT